MRRDVHAKVNLEKGDFKVTGMDVALLAKLVVERGGHGDYWLKIGEKMWRMRSSVTNTFLSKDWPLL